MLNAAIITYTGFWSATGHSEAELNSSGLRDHLSRVCNPATAVHEHCPGCETDFMGRTPFTSSLPCTSLVPAGSHCTDSTVSSWRKIPTFLYPVNVDQGKWKRTECTMHPFELLQTSDIRGTFHEHTSNELQCPTKQEVTTTQCPRA